MLFKKIDPFISYEAISLTFDFFDKNNKGIVDPFELKCFLKYDLGEVPYLLISNK